MPSQTSHSPFQQSKIKSAISVPFMIPAATRFVSSDHTFRLPPIDHFSHTQAQSLVHTLTYLNTPLPHRLLQIAFTRSAPVSTRTKVVLRLWFAAVFLLCAFLIIGGLRGAIRVYQVRHVWGERLMT